MSDKCIGIADKFLIIKKSNKKGISVKINNEAYVEACKYHGYFTLICNKEANAAVALSKYRLREKVEEYFKMFKDTESGRRARVWSSDQLMGRLIIQFIALTYEEHLQYKIKQIKETLRTKKDDEDGVTKAVIKQEEDLLKWLTSKSLIGILNWFDAYETTSVSETVSKKRWGSKMTKRDQLFMNKLREE